MDVFKLDQGADGDVLTTAKSGADLLRFPLYNKGTGFTPEERRRLGIDGLLPSGYNDIDQQADRIYKSIFHNRDDVGRHIGLAMLQDRNEVLFYRVLEKHLEEVMPIVYTPTVGKASRYYSRVFRRSRGVFITPEHRGRIEKVLRRAAPFSDVRLMVVTDNEAILGIGDQGAGGMAISVGKLALYCAGAGIHPAMTLPVSLDVGTDNETLLNDPVYLGYREPRLRGAEYEALVDEFVAAVRTVFPKVILQWEDFRKDNALRILDRYRTVLPSFNDDIQGTGAVAAACVRTGAAISKTDLGDSRILIYGAGAAGLGIARQLRRQIASSEIDGDALQRSILVMDSRGVISDRREGLDAYKQELAWRETDVAGLGLDEHGLRELEQVVAAYRPTVLIGASGQANSFSEASIRAMSKVSAQPIVLPMSNPTAISEAVPANVFEWSAGSALVATGSPFDDVTLSDRVQPVSQANNVFVFPGIGLGAMASEASEITGDMIAAAGTALSESVTRAELDERRLVPRMRRLRDVCRDVALAVARQAVDDGVAGRADDLEASVDRLRWQPRYPSIVSTAELDT